MEDDDREPSEEIEDGADCTEERATDDALVSREDPLLAADDAPELATESPEDAEEKEETDERLEERGDAEETDVAELALEQICVQPLPVQLGHAGCPLQQKGVPM